MKIIKRNGMEVDFNSEKIISAVGKANLEVPENERLTDLQIRVIEEKVEMQLKAMSHSANIEDIQNLVIHQIMAQQAYSVAQVYTEYRYKRALARKANSTDDTILSLLDTCNEEIKQENSNKNPTINSVQRDYMAGEVSKDITRRLLLPPDIVEADKLGIIHFHDADYFAQHMHNCGVYNIEDMLQNGTCISGTEIDPPKRFSTAANITTQCIAQIASSSYGGQTFSLAHLAPFVDKSRQEYRQAIKAEFEATGIPYDNGKINKIAEMRLAKEIKSGIQLIQYQLLTLMTTNGQTPFVSVYINLKEVTEGQLRDDMAMLAMEMFEQRIKGIKNECGHWITPAFPKILYVLNDVNTYKNTKYRYVTEKAAECTAKRMVPDYISEKIMKECKNGDVFPCMGCRSFLTVDRFSESKGNLANAKNYKENEHKYYGRFNQGVVTINLPHVALSSGGNFDKFWKLLDERLELCHRALRLRHERLLGTKSDISPILWQYGAIARLKKGETIDKLLYDGYSTLSLGYAGLYETCKFMTGKSHTDNDAKPFALKVMQTLNDKCEEWKKAENIDYSVYGTPLESTTYSFAKALQRDFGAIPEITDHNYITNSYHVNVREPIDAFTKLKFESEFQKLSPGGAISYVEVPNMSNNIPAVLSVIEFIYENIMYAELNTKSDYCQVCGYTGEIEIKEDEHKKLFWECPNCGNKDQSRMNVARRTCGYIGTQFWNQGRTQEIKDRVMHL